METKKINGFELKDEKARNDIKVLNTFIKPEQFGAVGDGVTDDSQAFIDMINYVESIVELKEGSICKDYSKFQFQFSGRYAISKPIDFVKVYGLILNNLKLIATNDFEGDYLIGFSNLNSHIRMEGCYLNGNLRANKCLSVLHNTLGFHINNCEITRFAEYGLYFGEMKGHETIVLNTKINQVEWEDKDNLDSMVSKGVGLYLDTERYDNHFTNVIINYCRDNTMVVKSGSNYFHQCHFYGKEVLITGYHNFINDCYFDTTPLHTKAQTHLKGCTFSGREDYFIKIIENQSEYWRTGLTYITDCIFSCPNSNGMATPIIFDESWTDTSKFQPECTNNIFDRVTPFKYKAYEGYVPAPWKTNEYSGNPDNGMCKIGDLLVQWGTITQEQASSGYIYYHKKFGQLLYVTIQPLYTETGGIPYPGGPDLEKFWANGIHGKCMWFAIGR